MFKVGDRVRIKVATPYGYQRYPNNYFNTFGTIIRTDTGVFNLLGIRCDKDNVIWDFWTSEIELIESNINKSNELMEFLLS